MKEIKSDPVWKIGIYRSENTMGDRVLFQVFKAPVSVGEPGNSEFGPVIYGHWCGSEATDVCKRIKKRMIGRSQDVEYTSARLVQEILKDEGTEGNTGFGIWNADALLKKEDSHGDAGIVLVDVSEPKMKFLCLGGYLKVGSDGFPYDSTNEEEIEENDKQSKQA